jgi:PAS domain S-box-containing protein/putative nucleotidyltransferase with HDIG domain
MDIKKTAILIIEDNPADARFIREILSEFNGAAYDFKYADRLSDALKMISGNSLDIVLLDLSLPDSEGLDALSAIVAANFHIPIVVLTGTDDSDIADRALGMGAQDYLVKGKYDSGMLSRSIRYAIERKKSEIELKKSERKFRSLFEDSVDGIYITTPQGKYIDVNKSLVNILGYKSKKELMSIDIKKELYAVEEERPGPYNRNRLFETRLKKKDGSIINVQISSSVISEDGKPKYYQGIVRDITEKVQFEGKLMAVAREWSNTFDAIEDAISMTDLEGRILRVNKAMAKMFCKSYVEIIGDSCENMISTFSHPQGKCPMKRARLTKKREIRIVKVDGKYFSCIVDPILDENNTITSTVHILSDITDQKKAEEEIKESLNQTRRTFEQTVAALSYLVEVRDPYTSGHQKRVADIALLIAEELGLEKESVAAIRLASLIHDIGKISIPASILSKPGILTDIEKSMIETHPKTGYEILKGIDFPYPIAKIILQHHERINGSGYPKGLKGNDILPEVKIINVADTFEAMSSHRPYRQAHSREESRDEILKNRGILYDPDVVDAFISLFKKNLL